MTEITTDEWMAELDRLRKRPPKLLMTDEQFNAIHYARTGGKSISWPRLAEWYAEKFGETVPPNTLMGRYNRERTRRGL